MESLINIDRLIFETINSGFEPGMIDTILTLFRNKYFWIPLYIFILSYILTNYNQRRWLIIIFFGVTIAMSDFVSSQLIKKNIQRSRPCHNQELVVNNRVHCGHGYSFPSSHACNHYAIGLFLFLLFGAFRLRFLFLIWAGVIGICQIYVGVHYPSDVLGGSLLGLCIGYISFSIFEALSRRYYSIQKQENVL